MGLAAGLSGDRMPGTVPDTVFVITFFPLTPDVTGEHPIQGTVALVGVAFGKTIVCGDVERERFNLLQVFVEERLKYVDFVRLLSKSRQSGIPLVLELR
jgi:hypothetical protein